MGAERLESSVIEPARIRARRYGIPRASRHREGALFVKGSASFTTEVSKPHLLPTLNDDRLGLYQMII